MRNDYLTPPAMLVLESLPMNTPQTIRLLGTFTASTLFLGRGLLLRVKRA